MEHHDDQSRQHVSAQSLSGEHGSGDARLRENEPREGSGTSAREKASPDSTACIGKTGGNISGNRPSGGSGRRFCQRERSDIQSASHSAEINAPVPQSQRSGTLLFAPVFGTTGGEEFRLFRICRIHHKNAVV